MNTIKAKTLVSLILITISLMFAAPVIRADNQERFLGNVIRTAGFEMGSMERLTMTVDRWTSEEEVNKLIQLLVEKGNDAMVNEMRKMKAEYAWFTATVRWPVNVATSIQTDQGRLITLVPSVPCPSMREFTIPSNLREYMLAMWNSFRSRMGEVRAPSSKQRKFVSRINRANRDFLGDSTTSE